MLSVCKYKNCVITLEEKYANMTGKEFVNHMIDVLEITETGKKLPIIKEKRQNL